MESAGVVRQIPGDGLAPNGCHTHADCPGGCGLCCTTAGLAASRSIRGLIAEQGAQDCRAHDPCSWSWEYAAKLILAPHKAGFHVVDLAVTGDGEMAAADETFDVAVLPPANGGSTAFQRVVAGVVRCVRTGGSVVVPFTLRVARQSNSTPIPPGGRAELERWIEALRACGAGRAAWLCLHPTCAAPHVALAGSAECPGCPVTALARPVILIAQKAPTFHDRTRG